MMLGFVETLQLTGLALMGSVVALSGGVIFLYKKSWSKFLEKHSIPFAAGVLITVALVGLLPEAVELIGEKAFVVMLSSFFLTYLFEHIFFGIHHHHEHQHGRDYRSAIPLVLFGDTIHNFIDGVAIGVAYMTAPGLGLITALSTLLHEVPHEIGDFGILLKAGWNRSKIVLVNLLSSASALVGAFAVILIIENSGVIGTMLSISAGIFLYLGASDFLPHIEEGYANKVRAVIPLALGVLVMLLSLSLVPHAHESRDLDHSDEIRENK